MNQAFYSAICVYRQRARKKGLPWKLTNKQFFHLSQQNCHYCGEPPFNVTSRYNTTFVYSGIDRVNNELGYSLDNCVPCCRNCNAGKGQMTEQEFFAWVTRIYYKKVGFYAFSNFD